MLTLSDRSRAQWKSKKYHFGNGWYLTIYDHSEGSMILGGPLKKNNNLILSKTSLVLVHRHWRQNKKKI